MNTAADLRVTVAAEPVTPDAAVAEPPLLELRSISKAFPGVQALNDVSFAVAPGEVHMLLGENGAGKSSLMKVLCGAYRADSGSVLFRGTPVAMRDPADARKLGIAVIFQEFSLVPHLDIAQNIFLGRELKGRLPGTIDRRRMRAEARRLLAEIGFEIDVCQKVHTLGVAQQQMVEIAKALSQEARILVMDEPTAALSEHEIQRLFAMVAKLKQSGVAIIFISHRLSEVFEIGDRITVLRDGKKVGSVRPSETTPDALVRMMVGRNIDTTYGRHFCETPGDIVLSVKNVSAASGIKNIDLEVRAGEIVGLCGLVGSGRTEVARAIFGADRLLSGDVRVFGEKRSAGLDGAVRQGMALIPESRKTQGLALLRSVSDNLVVTALPKMFPSGSFRRQKVSALARRLVERLRIVTPSIGQGVSVLSGGNQQKVVLGKWLAAKARLFIFDEPTRGIDIGAKAEIFALIDTLVRDGAGVLLISSEQSEIVHVCDRAYVMRDRTIVGELGRAALSEENILKLGMHHE